MALIYCPDCGKQVSDSAAACPNCGYPIASMNLGGDGTGPDYSKPETGKYNVFLTSALSEGVSATARVLADVLGYSYADALQLANTLPTIVLYNVTLEQAKAAACALADYGLDVGVYDENGYVDFQDYEYDAEDYTTTGSGTSIASDLLRTIRTITVSNLISRLFMRRYSYPYPYEYWIPFRRSPRFYYDPYYRRWSYYRRPTLMESLFGLNRSYRRYLYDPGRYSHLPQYRSNYRTPGGPTPRPGSGSAQKPGGSGGNGGGLFGGLFGGSGSSSAGKTPVGGASKNGTGHYSGGYKGTGSSFGGYSGSSSGSSGSLFGSLFGSSKSSGHSSSSNRSSSSSAGRSTSSSGRTSSGSSFGSSFGSSKSSGHSSSSGRSSSGSFGSMFGSSKSGGFGSSFRSSSGFSSRSSGSRSSGSFGSRSSGSSFGGGSRGGIGGSFKGGGHSGGKR